MNAKPYNTEWQRTIQYRPRDIIFHAVSPGSQSLVDLSTTDRPSHHCLWPTVCTIGLYNLSCLVCLLLHDGRPMPRFTIPKVHMRTLHSLHHAL